MCVCVGEIVSGCAYEPGRACIHVRSKMDLVCAWDEQAPA